MRRGPIRILAAGLAATCAAAIELAPGIAKADFQQLNAGVVAGAVTDAASGRPVEGATVSLSGPGARFDPLNSDSTGAFRFTGVPAGSYALTAKLNGYAGGRYGQRFADDSDTLLTINSAEHRVDLRLSLWPMASISGRLTTFNGEPLPKARVALLRPWLSRGKLVPRRVAAATTDDQGQYRVTASPSSYMVAVDSALAPAGSGRPSYPMTYYPGVGVSTNAAVFELSAGEHRAGVDFRLSSQTAMSVGGVAHSNGVGADGVARLSLHDTSAPESDPPVATATSASNGTFRFPAVFPGNYVLRGMRMPDQTGRMMARVGPTGMSFIGARPPTVGQPQPSSPDDPTLFGEIPVTVETKDLEGLNLLMRPSGRLRGVLEFDGERPPTGEQLLASSVIIMPADGRDVSIPVCRIEEDRTFRSAGLPPAEYSLGLLLQFPNYVVSRITAGGRDVTDVPLTLGMSDITDLHIRLTTRVGEIAGQVRDAKGQPAEAASVFLFPDDRAVWNRYFPPMAPRWRAVRSQRDGAFSIPALPDGKYRIVAIVGIVPEAWQAIKSLEALSASGIEVAVAGARLQLSLQATSWRR